MSASTKTTAVNCFGTSTFTRKKWRIKMTIAAWATQPNEAMLVAGIGDTGLDAQTKTQAVERHTRSL